MENIKTPDALYKRIDLIIPLLEKDDDAILHKLLHETAWTTDSETMGELGEALFRMKDRYPDDVGQSLNACWFFCVNHREIMGLDK